MSTNKACVGFLLLTGTLLCIRFVNYTFVVPDTSSVIISGLPEEMNVDKFDQLTSTPESPCGFSLKANIVTLPHFC